MDMLNGTDGQEIAEAGTFENQVSILLADPGLVSHPLLKLLAERAFIPRRYLSGLIGRLERGPFYSRTLRYILARHWGVIAGAYSYGELMSPGRASPGLIIGRYVSLARGVCWVGDHPVDRLSTHPIFHVREMGVARNGALPAKSLRIEHDAWIGENAIITTKCKRIGIGAVVGAGAIVNRDVPDFAIVAGSPARLIRYRFGDDVQKDILSSKWWLLDPHAVARLKVGPQLAGLKC